MTFCVFLNFFVRLFAQTKKSPYLCTLFERVLKRVIKSFVSNGERMSNVR